MGGGEMWLRLLVERMCLEYVIYRLEEAVCI
jgi:hypothetical protein